MPRSLSKVTKKVQKKKGRIGALHENSRDAQLLRRASAREDKLAKMSALKAKSNEPLLQRVAFFQEAAEATIEAKGIMGVEEVQTLIESWIQRHEQELEEIQSMRRPGRPASSREDSLKQLLAADKKEYDAGFWVPKITDAEVHDRLREWPGDWSSMNALEFIRVKPTGQVSESSFPPKGLS